MGENFDVRFVLNALENTPSEENDSMIAYATSQRNHHKTSLKRYAKELFELGEGVMPW